MMSNVKFQKDVTGYGKPLTMACDGKCHKAWGVVSRPIIIIGEVNDDFAYMSDDELGDAPEDPETYEGSDGKPIAESAEDMNKWCFRQCERCTSVERGQPIQLTDFSRRVYNIRDEEGNPL